MAGLSSGRRRFRARRCSKSTATINFGVSIAHSPRNPSARLGRKVGLYVYAQDSLSPSFFPSFHFLLSLLPTCAALHARGRARTRKPTEYSKKSCAFQGHGDILQTVDYHRGSVLKISVALGSHVPSAHKYCSCECHVSPSASGGGGLSAD